MTRRAAPLHADLEHRRRIPREPQSRHPSREGPSMADRRLLAATGTAWWLLLLAAMAVVPEADGVNAEQLSTLSEVAGFTQIIAIAGVALLLMSGHRRGAGGAMLVGGGVFLASAVACVATGHHAFGGWWYGQAAALGGMMVAGTAALRGGLGRRR